MLPHDLKMQWMRCDRGSYGTVCESGRSGNSCIQREMSLSFPTPLGFYPERFPRNAITCVSCPVVAMWRFFHLLCA